jgi:excisionase family DNA binding protein
MARMNTDSLPDDLLPIKDAARLVPGLRPGRCIHYSALYRRVLSGQLRAWRIGRRLLVSRADVRALIKPVAVKVQTAEPTPPGMPAWAREELRKRGLV